MGVYLGSLPIGVSINSGSGLDPDMFVQKTELESLVKTFGDGYFAKEKDLKDINVNELSKEFTSGYSDTELSNIHDWTKIVSPDDFTQRQRACVYGNGYFILAGLNGQLAYSEDAENWVNSTPFTSAVVTGLAYGNGFFLAVDSGGNIYRVDDPSNEWRLVYKNPVIIESVRYVNNKYYAVGQNGFIAYSFDGENWKKVNSGTTKTLIDICYGNGQYIAVGASGSVFTSVNGELWYDKSIVDYTTDIRAIVYANGQFVIGSSGGRIDYSEDGKIWTESNNPSSLTINWIRNFSYYANRLYAVMYASNGQGEIWISEDKGKTWSVEFTPEGTSRLWCIASGDNKFVASGDNGYIYMLDMNITWQNNPTDDDYEWYRFKLSQNDGSVICSDVYYNDAKGQTTEPGSLISQEDFNKLVNNETQIVGSSNTFKAGGADSVKDRGISIGYGAEASALSIAIGAGADTNREGTISIGPGTTTVNAYRSMAIGNSASVTSSGDKSIALGYYAKSKASKAIQIGEGTNANPNTMQVFADNIYNHNTHTLTVQNIELNGVDINTVISNAVNGAITTALNTPV